MRKISTKIRKWRLTSMVMAEHMKRRLEFYSATSLGRIKLAPVPAFRLTLPVNLSLRKCGKTSGIQDCRNILTYSRISYRFKRTSWFLTETSFQLTILPGCNGTTSSSSMISFRISVWENCLLLNCRTKTLDLDLDPHYLIGLAKLTVRSLPHTSRRLTSRKISVNILSSSPKRMVFALIS